MTWSADSNAQIALKDIAADYLPAPRNAIQMWADASTAASSAKRRDLLRHKQSVVAAFFFAHAGKHSSAVTAGDVKRWQAAMGGGGEATGKRQSESTIDVFLEGRT